MTQPFNIFGCFDIVRIENLLCWKHDNISDGGELCKRAVCITSVVRVRNKKKRRKLIVGQEKALGEQADTKRSKHFLS